MGIFGSDAGFIVKNGLLIDCLVNNAIMHLYDCVALIPYATKPCLPFTAPILYISITVD